MVQTTELQRLADHRFAANCRICVSWAEVVDGTRVVLPSAIEGVQGVVVNATQLVDASSPLN